MEQVSRDPVDVTEERKGEWMHTSLGGRFWPADPRPEDIHISDIGNGLALDCRYAGMGRVDRYYSVAEHCYHLGRYAYEQDRTTPLLALAVMFHDAAEAYINDLNRATKHAVDAVASSGEDLGCILETCSRPRPAGAYSAIEKPLQEMILRKYKLWEVSQEYAPYIKDLDCRIVPLEKKAVMRYSQPWAFDEFAPLPGVHIACFNPPEAKMKWCSLYSSLSIQVGYIPEEWEM